MNKKKGKIEAAVSLGKLRWANKSLAEIKKHMKMMGQRSGFLKSQRKKEKGNKKLPLVP